MGALAYLMVLYKMVLLDEYCWYTLSYYVFIY